MAQGWRAGMDVGKLMGWYANPRADWIEEAKKHGITLVCTDLLFLTCQSDILISNYMTTFIKHKHLMNMLMRINITVTMAFQVLVLSPSWRMYVCISFGMLKCLIDWFLDS